LRLLLDTHVLVWFADDREVAPPAAAALRDPDTQVFVSAASIWEAEVKAMTGKLKIDGDLAGRAGENGFAELPITSAHAAVAGRLPRHHADPFDRMLIAQARLEGLKLVTRDAGLSAYDVPVLAA